MVLNLHNYIFFVYACMHVFFFFFFFYIETETNQLNITHIWK